MAAVSLPKTSIAAENATAELLEAINGIFPDDVRRLLETFDFSRSMLEEVAHAVSERTPPESVVILAKKIPYGEPVRAHILAVMMDRVAHAVLPSLPPPGELPENYLLKGYPFLASAEGSLREGVTFAGGFTVNALKQAEADLCSFAWYLRTFKGLYGEKMLEVFNISELSRFVPPKWLDSLIAQLGAEEVREAMPKKPSAAAPAACCQQLFPGRAPAEVMSLKGAEDWMLRTTYFVKNECLQADFCALLRASERGEDVSELRRRVLEEAKALENKQWSEHLYNIVDWRFQCPHMCAYCYMAVMREHRHVAPLSVADVEDAAELLAKGAGKGWARASAETQRRLFMFPTSHDIIPQVVPFYLDQAKKMLDAGHGLIVVSKPHLDVMEQLADAFDDPRYKRRVVFRLTVTSDDPAILAFWEPGAPPLQERLATLKMLHERGFITSVSIEPYLSDPRPLVKLLGDVSETIWIGPMSGFTGKVSGAKLREQEAKWLASPAGKGKTPMMELLSPDFMYDLVRDLAANPKIYWKTAVIKAVAKML